MPRAVPCVAVHLLAKSCDQKARSPCSSLGLASVRTKVACVANRATAIRCLTPVGRLRSEAYHCHQFWAGALAAGAYIVMVWLVALLVVATIWLVVMMVVQAGTADAAQVGATQLSQKSKSLARMMTSTCARVVGQ